MSTTVIALNVMIKADSSASDGLRITQACVIYDFMIKKAESEAPRDARDVAIGAVVRARRTAADISPAEFGEKVLHCSPAQVSRFETGVNGFSWRQMCDIASYFRTTVGQLEAEAELVRESVYYEAQKRLLVMPQEAVQALLTYFIPKPEGKSDE